MKNLAFSLALSLFAFGAAEANAQTSEPTQASSTETAKSGADTPPIAGANSFTESQARERIIKAGFTAVTDLKQDGRGVWRANAEKGGAPVKVAMDFQGNIVQQ